MSQVVLALMLLTHITTYAAVTSIPVTESIHSASAPEIAAKEYASRSMKVHPPFIVPQYQVPGINSQYYEYPIPPSPYYEYPRGGYYYSLNGFPQPGLQSYPVYENIPYPQYAYQYPNGFYPYQLGK